MNNKWAVGFVAGVVCWAQAGPQSIAEARAAAEADLQGSQAQPMIAGQERYPVFRPRADEILPPLPRVDRPTGQSISVARLKHKVPKDAGKAFERAKKLSKAGDHQGAAEELAAAIRQDPEFLEAINGLGVENRQLGRYADAEAAFYRALEIDPTSFAVHYNLAVTFMKAGDLSAAEESARRAVRYSPDNPQVHFFLGYLLCQSAQTRGEGTEHVQYAARTVKKAKQYLKTLEGEKFQVGADVSK